MDRKYIRISKESGCFSDKYSYTKNEDDTENMIVPYESGEQSGRFKTIKRPKN